jgi:D-aminopeptidase
VTAGAERAVRRAIAGELRLLELEAPVTIEVDYSKGLVADLAASFPGPERIGDRTVRYTYADAESAYRAFLAGNRLAGLVD